MPKNKLINLLPQEDFDASALGRVLKWAMGSFRMIVIVTEMVVMTAFLSRFWLDAQNSDLSDQITIKSAQISAQADFEKTFRNTQSKLAIIKFVDSQTKPTDRLNLISTKIPADVSLDNAAIGETSTDLKGLSGSEMGIAQFLSNLQDDKSFKSVALGSINISENSSSTVFTVTLGY